MEPQPLTEVPQDPKGKLEFLARSVTIKPVSFEQDRHTPTLEEQRRVENLNKWREEAVKRIPDEVASLISDSFPLDQLSADSVTGKELGSVLDLFSYGGLSIILTSEAVVIPPSGGREKYEPPPACLVRGALVKPSAREFITNLGDTQLWAIRIKRDIQTQV